MTKEQIEAKIKEILSKDPLYQDVKITIRFKEKSPMQQKSNTT
jgi:hypothetical protein